MAANLLQSQVLHIECIQFCDMPFLHKELNKLTPWGHSGNDQFIVMYGNGRHSYTGNDQFIVMYGNGYYSYSGNDQFVVIYGNGYYSYSGSDQFIVMYEIWLL